MLYEHPQERAGGTKQPVGVPSLELCPALGAFQTCLHLQVGLFWEMSVIIGRDLPDLTALWKKKITYWERTWRAPPVLLLICLIWKLCPEEDPISVYNSLRIKSFFKVLGFTETFTGDLTSTNCNICLGHNNLQFLIQYSVTTKNNLWQLVI